jgi:hypothetical protein
MIFTLNFLHGTFLRFLQIPPPPCFDLFAPPLLVATIRLTFNGNLSNHCLLLLLKLRFFQSYRCPNTRAQKTPIFSLTNICTRSRPNGFTLRFSNMIHSRQLVFGVPTVCHTRLLEFVDYIGLSQRSTLFFCLKYLLGVPNNL